MPETLSLPRTHPSHAPAPLPVVHVSNVQDMSAALAPDADAVIWNRAVPQAVHDWLGHLPADRLPAGRVVLMPDQVSNCLADLFSAQGVSASAALDWLRADATLLARVVAELVNTRLVRLRLEPVFDNACSKLHIDNVVARLICTYRGPGTVLGLETEVESAAQKVPTGLPVLLKGKQWPSAQAPKLHHRSPAILGSGRSRLMLVLEGCTENDIFPAYDEIYQS